MKVIDYTALELNHLTLNQQRALVGRSQNSRRNEKRAERQVRTILADVLQHGDEALSRFSKAFDNCDLTEFKLSDQALDEAARSFDQIPEALKTAIETAINNITQYHARQVPESWSISPNDGITLGQRIAPIERVALYIPGGKAAYPSTVLMNVIPAQIAGVKEIYLLTPPNQDGSIHPVVLYTALRLGIRDIFRIGGAQAIAAAAFGTDQVPKADKIVGPGNLYVALAKRQVFGEVAIDMIAGPSEVCILADASANPEWLAADLLAQAEHDENAGLTVITTVPTLAATLNKILAKQLKSLPKAAIASQAIRKGLTLYQTATLDDAICLANSIAPEHLELMVEDPDSLLSQVNNAGSVFMGHWTPEALGDYLAGTNHTLPTQGTARFSSPLGVYDFIKRPSYLFYSKEALMDSGDQVMTFAKSEGLEAHSRSVAIRMKGAL